MDTTGNSTSACSDSCPASTPASTDSAPTPPSTYKVVVIYSGWPLSTIKTKLYDFGTSSDFGMFRVDRYKGEETNRTICLMTTNFFDTLMNNGYSKRRYGEDFCCSEYKLREHNFPKDGESNNLFISLPKELSASECRQQLLSKMDQIMEFGVFGADEMKINIPMKSRENDIHNGSAFMTFKREIPRDVVALVKILLHDTWLYGNLSNFDETNAAPDSSQITSFLCQCYWARERISSSSRESTGSETSTESTIKPDSQPKPKREFRPVAPAIESKWKKPLEIKSE